MSHKFTLITNDIINTKTFKRANKFEVTENV